MQNFEILASPCSWAGWFEPYIVANHEDSFSRIKAHIRSYTGDKNFTRRLVITSEI